MILHPQEPPDRLSVDSRFLDVGLGIVRPAGNRSGVAIERVERGKEGSLIRDVNLFLFPILIEGMIASAMAKYRLDRTPGSANGKPLEAKEAGRDFASPLNMRAHHER
jgi:hypothetical protein